MVRTASAWMSVIGRISMWPSCRVAVNRTLNGITRALSRIGRGRGVEFARGDLKFAAGGLRETGGDDHECDERAGGQDRDRAGQAAGHPDEPARQQEAGALPGYRRDAGRRARERAVRRREQLRAEAGQRWPGAELAHVGNGQGEEEAEGP